MNTINMPTERINDGDIVRHFKGTYYKILTTSAYYSEDHSLRMVVYQAVCTGEIWVRPYDMFMSPVDKVKYPNAGQEYRFERAEVKI